MTRGGDYVDRIGRFGLELLPLFQRKSSACTWY
ncbi:hypothetical protein FNBNMHLP_02346 [Aeromonas jandaei]